MTDEKTYITTSYLRKACKAYYDRNVDVINQKKRDKYRNMTPEQKAEFLAMQKTKRLEKQHLLTGDIESKPQKNPSKYQLMTLEQKEIYKAKQLQNYYNRKAKNVEQSNTSDKNKLTSE